MPGRFDYIRYNEKHAEIQHQMKTAVELLECKINIKISNGRAKSLALSHLEETYMWIGKAIRDMQVEETGKSEEVSERGE